MNLLLTSNQCYAEDPEALPMDFLEFLAEGIVIEDEYLDPLNYEDIDQDVMERKEIDPSKIAPSIIDQSTENQTDEVNNDEN